MNGFSTHLCDELLRIFIRQVLVVLRKTFKDIEVFFFSKKIPAFQAFVFTNTWLDHHVPFIVHDAFHFLGTHSKQVTNFIRQALEAQLLMLSSHNILNPQNGSPITLPSQDMVLGLYYITKGKRSTEAEKVRGEGKAFYSPEEVLIAYNEGQVDLHAYIKVKVNVREDNGSIMNKLI